MQYSAYIQDKMEYSSMIMNLGVRYDAFVLVIRPSVILYILKQEKLKQIIKLWSLKVGVSLYERAFPFSYGHFIKYQHFVTFTESYLGLDYHLQLDAQTSNLKT